MTQVKYTGTSDFQIFSKADFEKAGVNDQNKVTFARGEPQEVSEAAAKALTSTDSEESIFHDFSFVEVDEEGKEVEKPKETPKGDDGDPDSHPDQTDSDPSDDVDELSDDDSTPAPKKTSKSTKKGKG